MQELDHILPAILSSDRLILRQLNDKDDNAIFELRSNDSVNKFIGRPKQKLIHEAKEFIEKINNSIAKKESFYWGITLKENTTLIGTICLWNFSPDKTLAELGYELNPIFQGQGIMNEAIQTVINYASNSLKLKIIDAYCHKENISSIKLLIKNGFIFNENKMDIDNKNIIVYSLTNNL